MKRGKAGCTNHKTGAEYEQKAGAYLEEQGYKNSGVTMDRVTEGGRSVEYTVTIHHRKIQLWNLPKGRSLP